MGRAFTQLYMHFVWATWDRLPLIQSAYEQSIICSVANKCHALGCHPLAIGCVSDHVHLLVRIPVTITVANLIGEIKGTTSHLITHEIAPGEFFKWQGSYAAFTVSKSHLPVVKAYVESQKEHHAANDLCLEWEQTFADE